MFQTTNQVYIWLYICISVYCHGCYMSFTTTPGIPGIPGKPNCGNLELMHDVAHYRMLDITFIPWNHMKTVPCYIRSVAALKFQRTNANNMLPYAAQCFGLHNVWRCVLQLPRKFILNSSCVLSALSELSWVCSVSQTLPIQSWLSEPSMTNPLWPRP